MNKENYDYLKDQIFYAGFGNKLHEALQSKISRGKKEFQLHFQGVVSGQTVSAELQFSQSRKTEHYFFNSYTLELPSNSKEEPSKRKFYVNGRERFTLKEAYNLMSGRSVHKQFTNMNGEPYRAWCQLDTKEMDIQGQYRMSKFYESYGYDLEKQLERFPIREISDPDSRKLVLESLKRGNRQLVTFDLSSGPEKLYVEALPRFKAVCIYNGEGIRQEFIDDRQHVQRNSAKVQEQQRQIQVRRSGHKPRKP